MLKLILAENIWSGDGRQVDGILVEGATIVWSGKRTELGEPGSDTLVWDFGSAFICPGLVDTHVHLVETGINLLGCDLKGVDSIKQIQEKISSYSRTGIVIACGYDDSISKDSRFLNSQDLDEAISDRPVFVARRDSHSCILNSKALEEVTLNIQTPGLELDNSGKPTGVLRGQANEMARAVWHKLITDEEKLQGCINAVKQAHKKGVTGLHAMEGGWFGGDGDVDMLLLHRHEIPADITIYHQIMDVAAVECQGLPRVGGCVLLDGSFGSQTAALDDLYHDGVGDGSLYVSDEALHQMVWEASARGMQCAVHAIGERAIDQAIRIYEKAAGESACRALRHRIEHFELPRPEHIEKAAQLGLVLGLQPAFEYFWGGPGKMYEARLGSERRQRTNPLRDILDAGIRVGFGSDSDITPLDPLLGMATACNHPTPEQSVKPIEALRAYTVDAARLSRREGEVGILEAGFRSDIAVFARNPLLIAKEELEDIDPQMIMVSGEVVWINKETQTMPWSEETLDN